MPLNTGQGFLSDHSNEHFDGPQSVTRTIHPPTILLRLESILFLQGVCGCRKDAQQFK